MYAKDTNFQTINSDIRKAALYGCYDYDIENCHYHILSKMADAFKYKSHHIQHYLDHKKDVRQELADRFGITIDQAKECLIALIYGAKFSLRMDENLEPQDAIASVVGVRQRLRKGVVGNQGREVSAQLDAPRS